MGTIPSTLFEAHMEGLEEPIMVRADQRDYAAWEAHPENVGDNVITRMRFLVWNAGKRSNAVSVDWKTFNTKLCIYVRAPELEAGAERRAAAEAEAEAAGLPVPEDEEDEQGLDPGRRTATGT